MEEVRKGVKKRKEKRKREERRRKREKRRNLSGGVRRRFVPIFMQVKNTKKGEGDGVL